MTVLMVIWLAASTPNFAPVDCELVRQYVAERGKREALAWALGQITIGNYSWRDLRAAKRCVDASKGATKSDG